MKLTTILSASVLTLAIGLAPTAAVAKDHDRDNHRRNEHRRDEHRHVNHERRESHRDWAREHHEHERNEARRDDHAREAMHRWDRDHHQRYAHTAHSEPRHEGWNKGTKTGWDGHSTPPRQQPTGHYDRYRRAEPVAQRQPGPVVKPETERR